MIWLLNWTYHIVPDKFRYIIVSSLLYLRIISLFTTWIECKELLWCISEFHAVNAGMLSQTLDVIVLPDALLHVYCTKVVLLPGLTFLSLNYLVSFRVLHQKCYISWVLQKYGLTSFCVTGFRVVVIAKKYYDIYEPAMIFCYSTLRPLRYK